MSGARFIKIPLLLDAMEMKELLYLAPYDLYQVGRVIEKEEMLFDKTLFLEAYAEYVEKLKAGEKSFFLLSPALSGDSRALQIMQVQEKVLLRSALPLVQMQPHHIDAKLRSGVYGTDAISWGVQLSYPTLFQDPKTHQIEKVDGSFVNTGFFEKIRRWVRAKTRAVTFAEGEGKVTIPIRLGKNCSSWIHHHAGLKQWGRRVIV